MKGPTDRDQVFWILSLPTQMFPVLEGMKLIPGYRHIYPARQGSPLAPHSTDSPVLIIYNVNFILFLSNMSIGYIDHD